MSPGQMNYDYGNEGGEEEPAPQRMDFFGSGIGRSDNQRRTEANRRQRNGQCPTCGNQTHKVNFFTRKRTPLTVEGKCIYGTCLYCHPIEGYIRPPENQRGILPETIEASRARGVTPSEDEFSMVSGITMEPDLLRAAAAAGVDTELSPVAHMDALAEEGIDEGSGSNERSGSGAESDSVVRGDQEAPRQGDRRQLFANVAATKANRRDGRGGDNMPYSANSASTGDYSFDDDNGIFGAALYDRSAYLPQGSDSNAHLPHNLSEESRRIMDHQIADSDRDLAGFDVGGFKRDLSRRPAALSNSIAANKSLLESNVETAGGLDHESSRSLGGFQINNSNRKDLAYDNSAADPERYTDDHYGFSEESMSSSAKKPAAIEDFHGSLTHDDPPSIRGQSIMKGSMRFDDEEEAKTQISTPPALQQRSSKGSNQGSMSSTEIKKIEQMFKDLSKPSLKSWRTGDTPDSQGAGAWSVCGSRRPSLSNMGSSGRSGWESQHGETEVAETEVAAANRVATSHQSQHAETKAAETKASAANGVVASHQEAPVSVQQQQSSDQKQPKLTDVPIILTCMKAYPDNALLHEKAYDAMFVLATASDKRCKDAIVSNGGVEALVEGLWRHMENAKIQLAGLFALWALAASDDETDIDNNAQSNAVGFTDAVLISMQTHTHEASIQQVGCGILSCLARAAERNSEIDDGTASGAMYTVINAMKIHSASADMQEWGIQALYHECVNSNANRLNLVQGNSGGFGDAGGGGGIEVLYEAMQAFQSDLAIQEWGCRVLNCLSSDEKVAAALSVTVVGIEAIVNAMNDQRKNPKAVELFEEACGALSNLAVLTEQNNAPMRSTGAIKAIVNAMVLHQQAEKMHTVACAALANLAVVKESRIAILQSAGAKVALSSMRNFPQCALLQEEGCRLLRCMCLDDVGTKDFIAANAAISGIIRAMALHPEEKGVQEMAAAILASLAMDDLHRAQIFSLGGVEAIVKAMLVHPRDLDLQEASCTAFRNMSAYSDEQNATISSSDLNAVVRAMIAHPESEIVQENACCLFWNLSTNPSVDPTSVITAGEVKYIVKAMQNHPDSARVQETACGALWSLATSSVDIKNTVVSEGGIDAIQCSLFMYEYEIKVLERACGVLSSLSVRRPIAKSIAEAGCIGAVIEVMRNNVTSPLLMQSGSLLLRNLAAFNTNYAEEASSACSTILHAMKEHPEDGDVQREACGALWSLASHSETCKERILFSDGVDTITRVMRQSEGDELVMHEARGLMNLLV